MLRAVGSVWRTVIWTWALVLLVPVGSVILLPTLIVTSVSALLLMIIPALKIPSRFKIGNEFASSGYWCLKMLLHHVRQVEGVA